MIADNAATEVASIRLLHVEDSATDAFILKKYLEKNTACRYVITQVTTLAAAREALAGGAFDVILMDLSLPDAQGPDLLRAMRDAAPALPVVVVTGADDQSTGAQMVHDGAEDCLIKGQIKPDQLNHCIADAIERKRLRNDMRE